MSYDALGAFNGTLPIPTGQLIAFLRDPATFPYLKYVQMIPAPEIVFMYAEVHPDDAVRLISTSDFGWGYDDYRPTGKSFQPRVKWTESRTQRWDFPYTIGEATLRVWRKNGIDPKMLYDRMRAQHAALHRASRVVDTLQAGLTGDQTSTFQDLTGSAYWLDDSTGTEISPTTGNKDDRYLLIKRAFNIVKRKIHLATNGTVGRKDLVAVIPPLVAEAISKTGEIVEALKQSRFAKETFDSGNANDWNLPEEYAGFRLVVEDTARVFINQETDGSIADVSVAAEKDYILDDDDILFVSRPMGLDAPYGGPSFSTLQLYHFNGEGRVEAFGEPKHELIEGHVVMEDKVIAAAPVSGYKVTDVLSS